MKAKFLAAGLLGLSLAAAPAFAHHAINAQFDVSKFQEVTGVLTKVDWVNPHAYLHFDVKQPNGQTAQWSFESPPPSGLRRVGLGQRGALPLGQTYTISFNPSRNGDTVGLLGVLTYADGRKIDIRAREQAR